MIKTCFGTVVYKKAFKYLADFADSINNQDYDNFDVILLNDDLNHEELKEVYNIIGRKIICFNRKNERTAPELRIQLYNKAKSLGYDLLVSGDFDDIFSEDRISRTVKAFNYKYSFYYNDIYCFNKTLKFFNNIPDKTEDSADISEYNYLGLSNMALNLGRIDFSIFKKIKYREIKIFDWFFFAVILNSGNKGLKVDGGKTYYRLHEGNIAGISNNTLDDIMKEIDIKIEHYTFLRKAGIDENGLLVFYNKLKAGINNNKINILDFIDHKNAFWWGKINSKKVVESVKNEFFNEQDKKLL